MLRKAKKVANITLDVHLMVDNPEDYIDNFMEADVITFHIESVNTKTANEIIEKLRKNNKKIGISIKPKTRTDEILPFLNKVDMILIMTVEPGLGGQKLIPETIEKIKEIRKINNYIDIEVDGGINEETYNLVKDAGANVLVAGTAIFDKENKKEIIEKLKG